LISLSSYDYSTVFFTLQALMKPKSHQTYSLRPLTYSSIPKLLRRIVWNSTFSRLLSRKIETSRTSGKLLFLIYLSSPSLGSLPSRLETSQPLLFSGATLSETFAIIVHLRVCLSDLRRFDQLSWRSNVPELRGSCSPLEKGETRNPLFQCCAEVSRLRTSLIDSRVSHSRRFTPLIVTLSFSNYLYSLISRSS
jgi:hypothetical protein